MGPRLISAPGDAARHYHSAPGRSTTGRPGVAAWVALGANLGDPRRTLARARAWLEVLGGTRLVTASRVHHTAPIGPPQPDYLNAVVKLVTRLSPGALLAALQSMERAAGRVRRERWGPRTLDLDLLLYGDRVSADPELTLPHPRLHERAFVLAPLCDIDAGLVHPVLDRTMAELLNECVDADPHRERSAHPLSTPAPRAG